MNDQEFEFNYDDFLPSVEAQNAAIRRFGPIFFAIYNANVTNNFIQRNNRAVSEKKKLQNWGLGTVALALFALIFAAIDIALIAPIPEKTPAVKFLAVWLPLAAAFSGVISFIVGFFGAGIGTRKRLWLIARMKTELIRQWRAHYLLNTLGAIVSAAGDDEKEKAYQTAQNTAFQAFLDDMDRHSGALFEDMVAGKLDVSVAPWLETHMKRQDDVLNEDEKPEVLEVFYKYFRAMRFGGQENYARHITQERGKLRTHPGTQRKALHTTSLLAVAAIVGLHLLVTVGVLSGEKAFKSIYVHLATVVFALVALAVRALEDGLRPDDHLQRYAGYLTAIKLLKTRFAKTDSHRSKREISWELESEAFEETVQFLKKAQQARFLM